MTLQKKVFCQQITLKVRDGTLPLFILPQIYTLQTCANCRQTCAITLDLKKALNGGSDRFQVLFTCTQKKSPWSEVQWFREILQSLSLQPPYSSNFSKQWKCGSSVAFSYSSSYVQETQSQTCNSVFVFFDSFCIFKDIFFPLL